MVSSSEREDLPLGNPEEHHQISKDTRYHFNLAVYSGADGDDPALKVGEFVQFNSSNTCIRTY